MKPKLTIVTLLFYQIVFSQRTADSIYFRHFEKFIYSTEKLINAGYQLDYLALGPKPDNSNTDSLFYYLNEVKAGLRILDSVGRFSMAMAAYFENGRRDRFRDLTSPIAQLQCSYSHYMQNLRNAKEDLTAIVTAALTLDKHLSKGYPISIFCPYTYDEVRVNFGKTPSKKIDFANPINFLDQTSFLISGWYFIVDSLTDFERQLNKTKTFYFIDSTPIITAKNIENLKIYERKDGGGFGLEILFDKDSKILWSDATEKASVRHQRLAFILYNNLIYAPKILEKITNGIADLKGYTLEELELFKEKLEREK
ncbi:MAG TPA: hypothetical protein VLJ68_10820 [Chitinophagaceae bacterium]|nr:hypothetical protein [Chitinophagaceae bacterium]